MMEIVGYTIVLDKICQLLDTRVDSICGVQRTQREKKESRDNQKIAHNHGLRKTPNLIKNFLEKEGES
jgi:hypothetical protein